jgi:hypothetical protein
MAYRENAKLKRIRLNPGLRASPAALFVTNFPDHAYGVGWFPAKRFCVFAATGGEVIQLPMREQALCRQLKKAVHILAIGRFLHGLENGFRDSDIVFHTYPLIIAPEW